MSKKQKVLDMKNALTVVADIGNDTVKGRQGTTEASFYNLMVSLNDLRSIPDKDDGFYDAYLSIDGNEFLVGEYILDIASTSAEQKIGVERITGSGSYYFIMVAAILSKLITRDAIIRLYLSQPVFFLNAMSPKIINMFAGKTIVINRYVNCQLVEYTLTIGTCEVKQEASGALPFKTITADGLHTIKDNEFLMKTGVVIVDIGGGNTDVAVYRNGRRDTDIYETFNFGVRDFVIRIRRALASAIPGFIPTFQQVYQLINSSNQNGYYVSFDGYPHSVNDVVNDELIKAAREFSDTVWTQLPQSVRSIEYSLLAGGGSIPIDTQVRGFIKRSGIVLASKSDPHMTHTRGISYVLEYQKNKLAGKV
jgi:hypothetical protein